MEANIIHCGECAEVMRDNIPDNAIDLTVTSPPYDNLREYQGYEWDFVTVANELWRITKPGGVVVWVVADATINGSETGTSFRQALYFMSLGFNLHQTVIYEKSGRLPTQDRYYNVIEYMFVISKGKPNALNFLVDHVNASQGQKRTKDKVINKGRPQKKDTKTQYRARKHSRRSNVWKYHVGNNGNDLTIHPAIFPEALPRDHIISWSNPGDVVLDPFVGSGTTAKMAILTGRRYIGIDISEEYCQLARERVAKVEAQPMLIPFEAEKSEQSTMFD